MEEWRTISEFPKYEVSNLGRVRNKKSLRILSPVLNKENGYLQVPLCDGAGGRFWRKNHRLVAIEFIPNPNNLPTVNHINFDKSDPRVENLIWMSMLDNNIHARKGKQWVRNQPSSQYVGVSFDPSPRIVRRWRARATDAKSKTKLIGHYFTPLEAAKAYNDYIMHHNLDSIRPTNKFNAEELTILEKLSKWIPRYKGEIPVI